MELAYHWKHAMPRYIIQQWVNFSEELVLICSFNLMTHRNDCRYNCGTRVAPVKVRMCNFLHVFIREKYFKCLSRVRKLFIISFVFMLPYLWWSSKENFLSHRITEPLRLEKSFKIIKYRDEPSTITMFTPELCPQGPHLYIFLHIQGWWLHHFSGQPVPILYNPFHEKTNKQKKPPPKYQMFYLNVFWSTLRSFPLILPHVPWEKRPTWLYPPVRELYRAIKLLWDSYSPGWALSQTSSAPPHQTCAPEPSPALLPFSNCSS